jgi:hypothetical protein
MTQVLNSFDHMLEQAAADIKIPFPFMGEITTTSVIFGGNTLAIQRIPVTITIPSLPGGVSRLTSTRISIASSTGICTAIVVKEVLLGTKVLDGAYTNGSAMPSVTECGVTRTSSGTIALVVSALLNSLPGSITVKYVDQDGNAAENATAITLPVSGPVGSAGFCLLNAGDYGAQSLDATTGLVQSGGTIPTGTVKAYGLSPVFMCPLIANAVGGVRSSIIGPFAPVHLVAGEILSVYIIGSTATKAVLGKIFCVGD